MNGGGFASDATGSLYFTRATVRSSPTPAAPSGAIVFALTDNHGGPKGPDWPRELSNAKVFP